MSQKKTAGSSELRIRCNETLRRQLAEVLAVVIRTAKKKRLDDVRVGEPRSDNAVGGWK
jgi:hypothetical protein